MEYGQAVVYVGDGGKKRLAFVTDANDNGTVASLAIFGDNDVTPNVPRRAPKDYDTAGGGHTFHLRAEA